MTTLERIWGPLFDEESRPTLKLGQLLRGLALHIEYIACIEDYEPWHSIVITPTKRAQYYEDIKLSQEVYSCSLIFDGKHSSLTQIYKDLKYPHHLVQEKYDRIPDTPGLTPVGFERWATLLIQAHPEEEFERLQKAVLKMPISNPGMTEPETTRANEKSSGLEDEEGRHLAVDSRGISIPPVQGDVRLGALSSSDGSERWDYGRHDDSLEDDDDDDSESPRDYTACTLDDRGYCGHYQY